MNMVKNSGIRPKASPITILFLTAIIITLYFNPKLADPFNAAKFYLLLLGSAWLLGYLVFIKNFEMGIDKKLLVLVSTFIALLLFASLFTKIKYTAFFGETQRQIGFLTYLGFAIYMLISARYFVLGDKFKFYVAVLVLSFCYVIYGLMQHTGNDIVKWANQYNDIIGTLGNPNFAAAFMAILATLCFSFAFDESLSLKIKILLLVLTFGLIINIYFSNAKQGILTVGAGISLFICIQVTKKSKKLGFICFIVLIVLSIFSILGMLQSGPLEKYLYKESVSLRGFYWRAGINMLKNNIFTGVGVDSYGAYFKEYREIAYPLKFGFELNSTNAHNVPIQIFATGGFFLGIIYILIALYIFYKGLNGIKNMKGNDQVFLSGLFCAWIAFQIQSLVSIDNIGLSIWGWILGGIIIGISGINNQSLTGEKYIGGQFIGVKNVNILQPAASGILLIFALIFTIMLSKAESNTMQVRMRFNPEIQNNSNEIETYARKVLADKLAQPYYKVEVSDLLYRSGFQSEALAGVEEVTNIDSQNPTYLGALANMYEASNKFEDAINIRTLLINSDPYNIKNFLQLSRLYSHIGNISKAREIKQIILRIAPLSEQAKIVNSEIAN